MGTLVGVFFTRDPVTDFDGAQASGQKVYARFFHALLDRGVFLAPSAFEAIFVSLAHDDEVLERTIAAVDQAAGEVVRAS